MYTRFFPTYKNSWTENLSPIFVKISILLITEGLDRKRLNIENDNWAPFE